MRLGALGPAPTVIDIGDVLADTLGITVSVHCREIGRVLAREKSLVMTFDADGRSLKFHAYQPGVGLEEFDPLQPLSPTAGYRDSARWNDEPMLGIEEAASLKLDMAKKEKRSWISERDAWIWAIATVSALPLGAAAHALVHWVIG